MTQLTDRDRRLLVDLFSYRFLSVSQLAKVHFPNCRKARARLRKLHGERLVNRFVPTQSFVKQEHIYHLKLRGARIVAERLGRPLRDLRWRYKPSKPSFLKHALLINDFRIALYLSCRRAGLSYEFLPEHSLFSKNASAPNKTVGIYSEVTQRVFVPDGVFYLANAAGKKLLFFLEVDRGTEPVKSAHHGSSVISKLLAYTNYFDANGYRYYSGAFGYSFRGFRVLWLTSSQPRLIHIRDLCIETGVGNFLWLATLRQLGSGGPLAGVWTVPGHRGKRALVSARPTCS